MDKTKKSKGYTKSRKEFNPKKFINTKPSLNEAEKKDTVVISFGRMNPITVGHEKLVNKVLEVAAKSKGTPLVFLSQSNDKNKNPLTYDQKIKFGQKAFGRVVTKTNSKTIIQVAVELQDKFKNLVMVVGSDRVKDFEALLNKYNGKDYTFDSIRIESAGERDPDGEGVEGMSASKMRTSAVENDFDSFKSGLPNKLKSDAKEVFDAVRSGMNISEETIYEALNNQQRRKRAILMKKLAPKIKRGRERAAKKKAPLSKLKDRARKKAIGVMKDKLAKGKGYGELGFAQRQAIDDKLKKMGPAKISVLSRKLLPSVKQNEKDRFSNKNKKESVNETFELFLQDRILDEACRIDKVMKRPHMMMASNNTMKFDKRFKMYKTKNKTVDEVIEKHNTHFESNGDEAMNLKDIFNLQEAVEEFIDESLEEAKKIGSKVEVIRGFGKGKVGYVRRILKGEYGNLSARKLDLDLEDDGGQLVVYTKDAKEIKKIKESLDEAINKESPLYKQYIELKGKSVKDLKRIYQANNSLDTSGYDLGSKADIIAAILYDNHGSRRVKVLYNESLDEAKKPGLWANIRAKRKRGEKPAKPGEKGYPKTLDIEEAKTSYKGPFNVVKDGKVVNKEPMTTSRALDYYDSLGGASKGYAVKPAMASKV
jgi:hypothetical protein